MRNIYYVIVEQRNIVTGNSLYLLNTILKVFACDITDIDTIYAQYVAPMQMTPPSPGASITTYIFHRESMLFQDMAQPYTPEAAQPKEPTWEEREQQQLDTYKQHEAWTI